MSLARPGVYACEGWEIDLARRALRCGGSTIPLGGRAFEILEVLVQSRGELVGKYELMDRVWPGAAVEENALQFHISAIRKALGPDRTLLATVAGRGYRLLGEWVVTETSQDPLDREAAHASDRPFRSNLPSTASALVGRGLARQRLLALLSAYRVVTLTGPGGIGKSVLSLDVARTLVPNFAGDCWLVELAALSDPGLLATAVATALGLRLRGEKPSVEAVAQAIGSRKTLLVLDNCEHLVDAAAEFVDTIVRSCPNASVLATSREVLRIPGEYVYRVPPLEAPPSEFPPGAAIEDYTAVQMFIACLRASDRDLVPRPDELPAIGAICRRLDGIPLALEFAAARAAVLGAEQVAARLDDRFRLLTAGRRTALPRHQTLRATLDWSYGLLSEREKRLLRRLTVFAGGFTLEAAAAADGETPHPTFLVEGLAGLVGKSLVAVDGGSASGRWRLLETIRTYGLEKLEESGEAQDTMRLHAEYYRDVVGAVALAPSSRPSIEDLNRLGPEIDNVRAALHWSFGPAGDTRTGVVLTAAFSPVWLHLNLMGECRERIEVAVTRSKTVTYADPRVEMQLAIALGVALTFMMGSVPQTTAVLTRGLEIAERVDDAPSQMRALWVLWMVHFNIGRCDVARSTAERFLGLAERMHDAQTALVGNRLVGATLQYAGREREAQPFFERLLDHYSREADQWHTIWFQYDQRALARAMLARVLWLRGFTVQAKEQARVSLEEARASAHGVSMLYPLGWAVSPIAMMTGDLPAAERAIAATVDLAASHNATFWKVLAQGLQGKLLVKQGKFEEGLELLRGVIATGDKTGWTICYPEFLSAIAEGLGGLRQTAQALDTVEAALQCADEGERWYVPEILRIKGELRNQSGGPGDLVAAEDAFRAALDVAETQGALFWRLRAALSLARLYRAKGQDAAAGGVLAPICEQFTEGFEMPDFRAAKALLERVS